MLHYRNNLSAYKHLIKLIDISIISYPGITTLKQLMSSDHLQYPQWHPCNYYHIGCFQVQLSPVYLRS